MSTGITSLANLADMGAVYPFAGFEWLFTLVIVGFVIYFVASQIKMEKGDIQEDLAASPVRASAVPAE
jgi:hypothetical protein